VSAKGVDPSQRGLWAFIGEVEAGGVDRPRLVELRLSIASFLSLTAATFSDMTSSALASHLFARDQLIAQEKAVRFDAAKLADLTPSEKIAEATIRALRAEEHVSVWQKNHETPDLFPGMHFLTSRDTMVKTKLYQALKRMPVRSALARCLSSPRSTDLPLAPVAERMHPPLSHGRHVDPLPALPASVYG
jgi:hypothetical protein